MYRVYLDGVEYPNDIKGLDTFNVESLREQGFDNSEQVLRDKVDVRLSFYGKAYRYLCDKVANLCDYIEIKVQIKCNNIWYDYFDGIARLTTIQINLYTCSASMSIRDNSFQGYFKDFIGNDLAINMVKTRQNEPIVPPYRTYNIYSLPTQPTIDKTTIGVDVLELLQYIVGYYTDNKVTVVSDYFTINKFFITNGYNLNGQTADLEKVYFKTNYKFIFDELRKIFRIYQSVEGNTLRIEPEYYFYQNDVFIATNKQKVVNFNLDLSNFTNQIKIGNSYELDNNYYIGAGLNDYNEVVYDNCGACTVDYDSQTAILDLSNDLIRDTDVIYDAINNGNYVDDLFIIQYSGLDAVRGAGHYNPNIRNIDVVNNWFGGIASCINSQLNGKYVSELRSVIADKMYFVSDPALAPVPTVCSDYLGSSFQAENDPYNIITENVLFPVGSCAVALSQTLDYYTIPQSGQYRFRCEMSEFVQTYRYDGSTYFPTGSPLPNAKYIFSIYRWTDNTLTTLIEQWDLLINPTTSTDPIDVVVDSGLTNFNANEVVTFGVNIEGDGQVGGLPQIIVFGITSGYFGLIADGFSNEDIVDINSLAKPYQIEFEYPLCFEDWIRYKQNKYATWIYGGVEYWIKSIKYQHLKPSKIILVTDKFDLCEC